MHVCPALEPKVSLRPPNEIWCMRMHKQTGLDHLSDLYHHHLSCATLRYFLTHMNEREGHSSCTKGCTVEPP